MIPEKVATKRPRFKSNSLMEARFCSADISFSFDIPAAPAKMMPRRQTTTPTRMIRPEEVPNTSDLNSPRKIGGIKVALGYTAVFGTLMPPIFRGEFRSEVLGTSSGRIILVGVVVCLLGIIFAGAAGMSKEKEMSAEQKRASIKEFDLKRGLLVATFSGIMSACFAYGLAAGDPIKALSVKYGTSQIWQGLPALIVVLLGGFTTNFIWCLILNVRNRTGYQYFSSRIHEGGPDRTDEPILESVTDAPGEEMAVAAAISADKTKLTRAPMLPNYFFSALAGTTWYLD